MIKKIILLLLLIIIWFFPLAKSSINVILSKHRDNSISEINNNEFKYPKLGIDAPVAETSANPFFANEWKEIEKLSQMGTVKVKYNDKTDLLIGHSTDKTPHLYSSIFAGLNYAKTNDLIYIKNNNIEQIYTITDKRILSPDKIKNYLSNETNKNYNKLVLITCWPLFTSQNRLLVTAEQDTM
ncbi:MAG: sortase [Patescibacteria group bacterium]